MNYIICEFYSKSQLYRTIQIIRLMLQIRRFVDQVNNLHESGYKSSWNEEQLAARKDWLISRPLQFQYKRLVVFNLLSFSKVICWFNLSRGEPRTHWKCLKTIVFLFSFGFSISPTCLFIGLVMHLFCYYVNLGAKLSMQIYSPPTLGLKKQDPQQN